MNTQTHKQTLRIAYPQCAGLTLIEVLIALLVLSIGILGLASLQTLSLNFNTGAYQRTQAIVLAYDVTDRMRANRQAALNSDYDVAVQNPVPTCAAPNLSGTVAQQDLAIWRSAIACRLPQSTSSIESIGIDEFRITVLWDDDSQTPGASMQFQFTTAL